MPAHLLDLVTLVQAALGDPSHGWSPPFTLACPFWREVPIANYHKRLSCGNGKRAPSRQHGDREDANMAGEGETDLLRRTDERATEGKGRPPDKGPERGRGLTGASVTRRTLKQ